MPRRAKAPKPFATEAALCAAFIAALPEGWTAYAETEGWDILLVRADGFQVGVQAKLRLNAEVFSQALRHEDWSGGAGTGPDCRAILVPRCDCQLGLGTFSPWVAVTILHMESADSRGHARPRFDPQLPIEGRTWPTREWYELAPARRHKLPAYVPDVAAGASSPVQLTDWKIKALRIAVLLEEQGQVTREDFRYVGVDIRRWIAPLHGWLEVRGAAFVKGPGWPGFDQQHPVVYQQIKAETKWRPRARPAEPVLL